MRYSLLLIILALSGCSEPNKFEQTFSKPAWFDSIDAPEISTSEEVSALWQSEKRCCIDENVLLQNNRIFYKSCFNAISRHYDDEALVVKCLWLMDVGAESKQRVQLYRFLVDNFSHHQNSITRCANCMPGDTIARATLSLARYESRLDNSKQKSIQLIENLLDTRLKEISYWVQAEIYAFLGRMYLQSEVTTERINRFQETYERFNRIRKHNEPLNRRYASFEKMYKLVMEKQLN